MILLSTSEMQEVAEAIAAAKYHESIKIRLFCTNSRNLTTLLNITKVYT